MEQDEADSFGILIGQLRGFANAENDKLVIGFVHPTESQSFASHRRR